MSYETWDERSSFEIPRKHSSIFLNPNLQILSLKNNCRHFLWDQVPELNGDRFDEWYKNEWDHMRCALAIKITNSFIHSSMDVGVLCQNCENLVQSYEKNRTAVFYHTFFAGELPSCLSCKTSDPHDYRPPYTCVHCCVLKFDVRPDIQEKFRNLLLPENRFLMKYGNTTLW